MNAFPLHKAVFFDKDGTLIHDVPYNADPDKVRIRKEAFPCLLQLQKQGYKLIVVTNQAGIAHGLITVSQVQALEQHLKRLFCQRGIRLDGFYHCPHHPEGRLAEFSMPCRCRKPMPGMLHRAAAEHHIDLTASWMVGDILHDIEAGRRAGCRTILLDVGSETEWVGGPYRTPHHTVLTLEEAARIIISRQPAKASPSPSSSLEVTA